MNPNLVIREGSVSLTQDTIFQSNDVGYPNY